MVYWFWYHYEKKLKDNNQHFQNGENNLFTNENYLTHKNF